MIKDNNEFNKFMQILPELKKDEVFFISLSARSKYLNEEERSFYSLGRTEMFAREIAFSKEDLEKKIKVNLPDRLKSKRTNNGKEIPEKCLVTYINLCPSSMIKAYNMFNTEMSRETTQVMNALINNHDPNYDPFLRMKSRLMNCIQKSHSYKPFIDIDIDIDPKVYTITKPHINEGVYTYPIDELFEYKHYRVNTQGGCHILIKKDDLDLKNLEVRKKTYKIIKEIEKFEGVIECKFNSNLMIPVAGCLHAGKLVTING